MVRSSTSSYVVFRPYHAAPTKRLVDYPPIMTQTRVRAILLVVPALWGLVFVGVNQVLRHLDVFQLVTIRFLMIAVAFGTLIVVQPRFRPRYSRAQWKIVWLAGLMAVPLSQLGIVYAQNFLAPTLASLVITTSPAVAAILAPLMLPETITRRQALGFVLALIGAGVVIVIGAGGASFSGRDILGAAIGLITPVAWAIYTILLKKLSGGEPLATIGIGLVVGTVFLIPFVPSAISAAQTIDGSTWAWLAYLAFGGTFLAYVIWFWSLKFLEASQTVAYLYLVPLFALGWSLLILEKTPDPMALSGGILVLIGVGLTQRAQTIQELPVEP